MRSITAEALWGTDSKCLWCSRNIHVSGALQNPIGLAAFVERQMNNQRGGWGIQSERSFGEKKRKIKKWKSEAAFALLGLWSPSSSRHCYTQRHTGSLSSSSIFSLSSPSFISSTSLHLYPWFAPGSPLSPSTHHSFAVQALISVCRKINSLLWIHFSSYHGFNNGNKAKAFQPHWLTSICYS